ncbi:MAG: DegT/DnrJ/EryC1/StrS family aminotransferase, partial [Verrucomicrobiota bacterium]
EAESIEARPVWKPMHLQPVFAAAEMHGGKVCERLFEHGLCLPSGAGMNEADRNRVIQGIKKLFS